MRTRCSSRSRTSRQASGFRIVVDGADALDAFHHPYAYDRGAVVVPEPVVQA